MNFVELEIGNKSIRIDTKKRFDLSIPLHFKSNQLNAFGASPPKAESFQTDNFLGDTQRGGSCNVQQYTLIPHCHGTHTECVGHLVDEPVYISEILEDVWIPATLISIRTESGLLCSDRYTQPPNTQDALISKANLAQALQLYTAKPFHQALIVRTLPNDAAKRTVRYTSAPYFTNDAMEEIVRNKVQHLLVDLPSIDRLEDQGRLSNHRIFWQLQDKGHALDKTQPSRKTITELIYAPNEIKDGYYFLNLQIPRFMTDTAPSRPIIFAADAE